MTGASSGIGRRVAMTLAKAGTSVVCVSRSKDLLSNLLSEAKDLPLAILPWDLLSEQSLSDLAEEASRFFGPLDILVNAAGINLREPIDEVGIDSWRKTIGINLEVPFFLARALVPGMKRLGRGNIVNFGSLQSFRAFANSAPYGASKGGVVQLTRAMAEAWSPDGVVVNAVIPGFFPTPLTKQVFADKSLVEKHAQATAVGRNGQLEDLDGAIVFLCSHAASYITGQAIPVDGGYLAK